MLQHSEDARDLAHKIAKEFDAEYWETSSKTGTIQCCKKLVTNL